MGLVKSPPLEAASGDAGEAVRQATIERILELRTEIEQLLEALPPETRREVERRWRELREARSTERDASSSAAPPTSGMAAVESPTKVKIEPEAASVSAAAPAVGESLEAPGLLEESGCGGFRQLDSDLDGLVSGADRHWRYLRLWFDENGDAQIDDAEIESLYALGVREIDAQLRFHSNELGDAEDIDLDEYILLRNVGKRGQRKRAGVLVVDSDRLARDGVWILTDVEGRSLSGFQPLGAGTALRQESGRRIAVLCTPSGSGA